MSTHTPGPWVVQESFNEGVNLLVKPVPGQVVAEVDKGPNMVGNARLIAAAPDLLAALCELVGIAEFDLLDDKSNVWRSALINANAAIAKAEGRSE